MSASVRRLSSVGIAVICGVAMASCGGPSKHAAAADTPESISSTGPLPNGVVAAVQRAPITTAALQHWLGIAYNEISLHPQHQSVPSPPTYASCVTTLRAQSGPVSKEPTTALRSQCEHSYNLARSDAIGFLIRAQWLQQEGSAQHVVISSSALNKAMAAEIHKQHPGAGAFKKFLAKTGMSSADFRLRARLELLAEELQSKGQPRVTASPAQIARYYHANLSTYRLPPNRKTLVVETHTRAEALKAKAALISGRKWATVAKRYSIDLSKYVGGVYTITKTEGSSQQLVHAVFSAPHGRLLGPIEVTAPYHVFYVFKVTGGRPGSQEPLSKVSSQIKEALTLHLQEQAAEVFTSAYHKRWKTRTRCRNGYVVPDCNNGTNANNGI